jgi:hypothetical protein
MGVVRLSYGPRPGFEFECGLAWKHRHIAHAWMMRIGRNPFAVSAYMRAFKLWSNAVERTQRFGRAKSEMLW